MDGAGGVGIGGEDGCHQVMTNWPAASGICVDQLLNRPEGQRRQSAPLALVISPVRAATPDSDPVLARRRPAAACPTMRCTSVPVRPATGGPARSWATGARPSTVPSTQIAGGPVPSVQPGPVGHAQLRHGQPGPTHGGAHDGQARRPRPGAGEAFTELLDQHLGAQVVTFPEHHADQLNQRQGSLRHQGGVAAWGLRHRPERRRRRRPVGAATW